MNLLAIPLRQDVEATLRFPFDLDANEFEDLKDYIETFLRVQRRKMDRASSQQEELSSVTGIPRTELAVPEQTVERTEE